MEKNLFDKLLFIFLVVIAIYFFLSGINLPYVGPNAANFNDYSLIAKNYNLFGFWNTKLGEIVSVAENLPDNPDYYLHHPPLLSIIEALFFKIFGYGFWVGRMVVILFSLGSVFLIFNIAKNLLNKTYAWICAIVYLFIPSSVIFGKMIGQEPLVLFFVLLTILLAIKYLKRKSKIYIPLIILSVILGTLSDWPMVYFSLLLSVYLFFRKEFKLGLIIPVTSIGIASLFLIYIHFMMSGLSDIGNAIFIRSLGEFVGQPLWFFRWLSIIALRFIIYFNPIFMIFAFYCLLKCNSINKNFFRPFILILLAFGLVHVLFYPEGSFGHPYWIYYLVPFIVFSSSLILFKLFLYRKYLFFSILIVCFVFTLVIQHWKQEQIKSNVWRYSLAEKADVCFYPYESILINMDSAIDFQLLKYVFSHNVELVDSISKIDKDYSHFLYSCVSKCPSSDRIFTYLINNHKNIHITQDSGEAFVFDLKAKTMEKIEPEISLLNQKTEQESLFRKTYRFLRDFLKAPQI